MRAEFSSPVGQAALHVQGIQIAAPRTVGRARLPARARDSSVEHFVHLPHLLRPVAAERSERGFPATPQGTAHPTSSCWRLWRMMSLS
jgi:hypothetical protein